MTNHAVRAGLKASSFQPGRLTAVANPKAAISVASIFLTTTPDHPSSGRSLAAAATMIGISVVWRSLVACLFAIRWLSDANQWSRRRIDRLAVAWFTLFGTKLALEI